ncbi:hypothetical protein IKE98_00745 [Candidatus Saccharibacteria bacterium]|nr:hypothetical protein [Candidatus Saccharibacteria bacterium]
MENDNNKINNDTGRKDPAKEKIILFIIGVLVGAVISTGAFFAYIKLAGVGTSSNGQPAEMQGGTPPEMPSGEDGQSGQGGTPPEKPGTSTESTNN